MNYLVIDTSAGTSVALVSENRVCALKVSASTRSHAEVLVPFIDEVLQGDVSLPDAVIVGTGPAPFTGLRAGLMAARVFGYAQNIPVYGVCALEAQALPLLKAHPGSAVVVVTDARRKEVYTGIYTDVDEHGEQIVNDVRVLRAPDVMPPKTLAQQLANLTGEAQTSDNSISCRDSSAYAGVSGKIALAGPALRMYADDFGALNQFDSHLVNVLDLAATKASVASCALSAGPKNNGMSDEQLTALTEAGSPCPMAMVRLVETRLQKLAAGGEADLSVEPRYLRRPDVYAGVRPANN